MLLRLAGIIYAPFYALFLVGPVALFLEDLRRTAARRRNGGCPPPAALRRGYYSQDCKITNWRLNT